MEVNRGAELGAPGLVGARRRGRRRETTSQVVLFYSQTLHLHVGFALGLNRAQHRGFGIGGKIGDGLFCRFDLRDLTLEIDASTPFLVKLELELLLRHQSRIRDRRLFLRLNRGIARRRSVF